MKTRTLAIGAISDIQKAQMYQIMNRYYDHISREQFDRDLAEKTDVILLMNQKFEICGFSSILQKDLICKKGQRIIALYSGDTVLEKEYWGNGALGLAFGNYLTGVKLKNPLIPTFWFLISKGYKTYLLMANNFPTHYPNLNKSTPPKIKNLKKIFYGEKFGESYDSSSDLIQPKSQSCALKIRVADIDESLLLHPRIKFFVTKNPNWRSGEELACIAEVTLWIPLRYLLKQIYKYCFRIFKPTSTKGTYALHKNK